MRKGIKRLIILIASVGSVFLLILLLVRLAPVPPEEEVEMARHSLSGASRDKADTYSKKLYSEAQAAYDSAIACWRTENKRFIFFRNFSKVEMFARLSAKKAGLATESSRNNSTALRRNLKDKIESLNKTAGYLDRIFGRYPMSDEVRNRISEGKFLLKEGEVAYKRDQFLPSDKKLAEAEYLLTGAYENTKAELKDYFKSYSTWKQLYQSAIKESRTGKSYSIIVDKFSRKLYLYYSGEKKYEFETELGRNWVGNKRRMGDKATPEGLYKIVNKFQGKQTEFYKSLSLDYPNAKDRERFKAEISKGTIPAWANIGGGIEIHGGGGKGFDWTEGCIALTDKEIDIVFNVARIGTPVTIIGSAKDINQILEN